MKIVLVPWTLLLFGASLCSGHYIRQTEDNFNVYSVKDGSSGITFVNPKPKEPTLREILYYHVIEREPGEQGHPITERSFTNSHGYQFLEKHTSDEQEQYGEEEHDDYLRNKLENDEHEENEEPREGEDENDHDETGDEVHEIEESEEIENQDEVEPESSTTPRPLTDADVKDAYKARSYLFDQMRQRYAVKRMADSLYRRKREADTEELKPLPDAPRLSSDISDTPIYTPPKTYGMNIKPAGGYVWNNLNKPNSYYELGASSGSPSEGQDASPQSQETTSPGNNANEEQVISENSETSDSDAEDLSDICVDINKPCALPLQNSQEPIAKNSESSSEYSKTNDSANSDESMVDNGSNDDSKSDDGVPNYPMGSVALENLELSSIEPNSESGDESDVNSQSDAPNTYGMSLISGGGHVWNDLINPSVSFEVGSSNENPESSNSEANYPVEPIIAGNESDDSESDDGASVYPMKPDISGNAESSYPAEVVVPNPEAIGSDQQEEFKIPQESSISEGSMESSGSNENAGSSYEVPQQEDLNPGSAPQESTEGEKVMAIPEAPTLSPLNYDNLQSYINGDIILADKPVSNEQTDNTYTNPQPYPEDTKDMVAVLATVQPPEDIPKTYGMNLSSDGGHVWNTLVNPPVSYDIGSSNVNPEPINPIPEPSTSDTNNPAEPIASEDAASNSESNEGANNSQGSEFSEIPELNYPVTAENPGTMGNANNKPDEPHTYGMNLNTDGVHVWNTMVNPAVSYDIGSSSEQPEPNNSEAIPTESVIGSDASNDNSESNEGAYPQGPAVNLEPSIVEPVVENPATTQSDTNSNEHSASSNENSEHKDSEHESNESYGSGYGGSQLEVKPVYSPDESSEGDKPKEPFWNIPEAPTLPPLNYDNLPDYIKNVISSTEKPGYYQTTDSPTTYTYPQTTSEDKKTMEDKMEDIFATIKPAGDVPNTYGMSLNGDGGHVWNDLVNPPVSYDVGAPSKSEEEHKEEPTQVSEAEEPESHKNEEDTYPTQEQPAYPAYPEKEESEEPIANQEPEREAESPATEYESIKIPAEQEPVEPETAKEFENPDLNPEPEHENNEEVKQPQDVEEPSEENHDGLEEQENEQAEAKPEEGNSKPDIMDELLESEQFWRWLGLWTATYMELLEKHIRKIALEEICNHQRIGNQMCPIKNYSEEAGVIMIDEKDFVDNKEMDLKDTDNLDGELKRGHHNQNNHNKPDGNKIEATTIYGNSVGNEKVTNVFIFTADKADKVIDKLKPANNSEIDYIIDERIKEEETKDKIEAPGDYSAHKEDPDVDEVSIEEPIQAEANEEQSEESDANKEANKEESIESAANNKDKEEINKEEAIPSKSDEEELNIGEDNKQESIESEPKEEEFEKVENSKEESNIQELEKEQSNESEPNEEGLNKEEPSEDASNEGEVNKEGSSESDKLGEELTNKENNKEDSNKSKTSEEELNVAEDNKEGSDQGEANKEENKEDSIDGEKNEYLNKEASNDGEANTEELNKEEESKEELSKEEANAEEVKDESNEGEGNEKELNNDEENKKDSSRDESTEEELNKDELKKDSSVAETDKGLLITEKENKKESTEFEASEEELNKEVKEDEASEGSNYSKVNLEPAEDEFIKVSENKETN